MRTALFVPGSRPERFQRALQAGADAVIIDLEDAVAAQDKAVARSHIEAFAQANPKARFMVRINGATSAWFAADLDLCARLPAVEVLVLPKAESAGQLHQAGAVGKPLLPIVESARGVLALGELAGAAGVQRLSFGTLDFMLDVGAQAGTLAAQGLLEQVRCQILLHSAAQGLAAPLDGVYPDFADADGLRRHARHVCEMGFGGLLCVHPAQLAPIHEAFAPTAEQCAWARAVLEKAEETGESAFQLNGEMVDAPVIERARRIAAACA